MAVSCNFRRVAYKHITHSSLAFSLPLSQVSEDRITPFFLDLEDHSAITEACDSMLKLYGKVDVLINNAGMGCRSTVQDTDLDVYKKVMDLNYFGQIAVTKGQCSL